MAERDQHLHALPITRQTARRFDFQQQVYNQSHADIPAFIERIRRLCDSYGAIFTVAEVGGANAEREVKKREGYFRGSKKVEIVYSSFSLREGRHARKS